MPGLNKVSLGKAHRFLQQLRGEIRGSHPSGVAPTSRRRSYYEDDPKAVGVISFEFTSAVVDPASTVQNAVRRANTLRDSLSRYLSLLQDAASLKEAIFVANQKSGLSRLLSEREVLNQTLALQSGILKDIEEAGLDLFRVEDLNEDMLVQMGYASKDTRASITLSLYAVEEVRGSIRASRVRLNALDELIQEINSKTKVTLDLSEASRALLGL